MKFLRLVLVPSVLLLLIVAAILWWNRPIRVDMAAYAPADSLIYIELNSLIDVAKAIEQNEVWKDFARMLGTDTTLLPAWSERAAGAGLAPVESVVFTRAQFALAMVGLNSVQEGDTLRVRPEIALIVETHTSNWRIKSSAIDSVKRLATYAYGQSRCTEGSTLDAHYIECSSTVNDRKLVGAIDGSVVIVGNAAKAVQSCLEVRRGLRPSLQTDADLQRLRKTMQADSALTFGYISSANTARIFSWATPLLLGQVPGDRQLQDLLATSATKILRAIAWTSRSSPKGFEDRYLLTLDDEVRSRLEPAFNAMSTAEGLWRFVPQEAESLTIYDQNDPLAAWASLNSAISYKLDAVSAVVFASLLRASLAVYGIENPPDVLANLDAPLATMRSSRDDKTAVLIAQVPYPSKLRLSLQKQFGSQIEIAEGKPETLDSNREFAAVLLDGYVLMGRTESVKMWLEQNSKQKNWSSKASRFQQMRSGSNVAITTFANDDARVNTFIVTLSDLRGKPLSSNQVDELTSTTEHGIFSMTETSLNEAGIERKTRSPFGQFSTLLSFVKADSFASAKP